MTKLVVKYIIFVITLSAFLSIIIASIFYERKYFAISICNWFYTYKQNASVIIQKYVYMANNILFFQKWLILQKPLKILSLGIIP